MIGKEIHNFALKLWPLNRSITGEGLRETLKEISEHLPDLKIKSFKSDLKVFDRKVPEEWHVKEAYIIDPEGKKAFIVLINARGVTPSKYTKGIKNLMDQLRQKNNKKSMIFQQFWVQTFM